MPHCLVQPSSSTNEECRLRSGGTPVATFCEVIGQVQKSAVVPSTVSAHQGMIIFDWDDTLFPTSYIEDVVLPFGAGLCHGDPLPSDSPHAPLLAKHAEIVEKVLRTARSCGKVGIVTLGRRHCVQHCATRFFPSLDLQGLLHELDIPVIYARSYVESRQFAFADQHDGINLYAVAKRLAMRKVLKKHRLGDSFGSLISIGDSQIEHDAAKDLVWACAEENTGTSLCKTVKLMEEPSLKLLGDQLNLVSDWLGVMTIHPADFDMCIADNIVYA